MKEIIDLLVALLDALKPIISLIGTLLENPVLSIIGGLIIAFVPRYVFWALGLALIVYGAVSLLTSFLGIRITLSP